MDDMSIATSERRRIREIPAGVSLAGVYTVRRKWTRGVWRDGQRIKNGHVRLIKDNFILNVVSVVV